MTKQVKRSYIRLAVAVLIGFALAIIWLVAVRMALVKNNSEHYHANFAVFVNGEQLKFEGPTFYEEVAACGDDGPDNPRTRVHMHDNINYVVHVHDNAATWGHFFANLRYALSDKSLTLDDQILIDGADNNQLTFILNGEVVSSIANRTIASEDVLLISYGQSSQSELDAQYQFIKKDVAEYNKRADPSACTGAKPLNFSERFRRAIEVNPAY